MAFPHGAKDSDVALGFLAWNGPGRQEVRGLLVLTWQPSSGHLAINQQLTNISVFPFIK